MDRTAPKTDLETGLKKTGWRLLPYLLLMYVLAFLDRTNIAFAHDGLTHDAGLSEAAYALGASIFFAGYAVLEIPSNLILERVGPRLWLSRIMVSWGLVSAAMMFVHGTAAFYGLRFALGVCEAGFFPGVIWYLTRWYPPERRSQVFGLFYFGAPLSFILGGPVSGWLLALNGAGGLHGWQWLFLIDGLAASVAGIGALWFLTDRPEDASWLSAEEKQAILAAAGPPPAPEPLSAIARSLARPRVLAFAGLYGLIQMSVYGVVFFLPAQVAALLGHAIGPEVGFVSAAPWGVALVVTWLVPRWCDRHGHRQAAGAILLLIAALGMAASVATSIPAAGLIALSCAAAGFIAVQPLFWSLASQSLSGARAAAAIALINTVGSVGSFLAPNLRTLTDSAMHHIGAGLWVLAALTALAALLMAGIKKPASV